MADNPADADNLEEYKQFLIETVERYDGDGIDDTEGSPVITYWEIDNEPDLYEGEFEKTPWKGELEETGDYALVLKTAYNATNSYTLIIIIMAVTSIMEKIRQLLKGKMSPVSQR